MNEAPARPLLVVEGVRKEYEGGGVVALDHVDLSIAAGEFVSIVGRSGSGKSTLLHVLSTLDRPTSGRIVVDGTDLTRLRRIDRFRARTMGFVFQLHNLVPNLTLLENVLLPTYPLPISGREMMARARGYLERLGIGHRMNALPVQVSGGERQRAAIARALVNHPKLLFADEPTGNVDSSTGDAVMNLLLENVRERGVTLVMVTHDPKLADLADRKIEIADGRIRSITSPERIAVAPVA